MTTTFVLIAALVITQILSICYTMDLDERLRKLEKQLKKQCTLRT